MTRLLIGIILFTSFSNYSFSQEGIMHVTAFENSTGDLKDNQIVDSVFVKLSNSNGSFECMIPNSGEERHRCQIPRGKYQLICRHDGKEIIIDEIYIYADSITMIEILFEPEQELLRREKRIRNKKYANSFD